MPEYAVRFQQLASVPLAVVRRQVSGHELSRVVPECCGLVWNRLRAQNVRGGLSAAHAAIHEWSRVHNHRLAGPKWEIYGHWLPEWDADPSKIRTDVFYQVVQE